MGRGSSDALVLWLTGLSGAGKSTIADAAMERLAAAGRRVLKLDGDVVREHLHRDLGFGEDDVVENNHLIAELCRERSADHDVILVPVIAPLRRARAAARVTVGERFRIIHCAANLDTVRARDVKGLYARADRGEIPDMIGYSKGAVAYEPPENPDLVLETGGASIQSCVDRLCAFIEAELN